MGGVVKSAASTAHKRSFLCRKDFKRRYQVVINKDIYQELEEMSGHNPNILSIAHRLADFMSEFLREDGAPLLDIILAHAMTEWSTRYATEGCNVAYREYCTSIFRDLPKVFGYRVTGKRGVKPFAPVTWDATECGLVQWMSDNHIINLKIELVKNNSAISQREQSFLVANQVFTRNEVLLWGVADVFLQEVLQEQEIVTVYEHDEVQQKEKE